MAQKTVREINNEILDRLGLREIRINALQDLGRAAGIKETGLSHFEDIVDQFETDGDMVLHRETHLPALEFIVTTLRETAPHLWPDPHDRGVANKAFLERQPDGRIGNQTARSRLFKEVGAEAFKALEAQYAAGKEPEVGEAHVVAATKQIAHYEAEIEKLKATLPAPPSPEKPGSSNPWLAKNFNVTKQAMLVKSLGIQKASAIAKAAGCTVGCTKPNPLFN
jgi:hypothetical protein